MLLLVDKADSNELMRLQVRGLHVHVRAYSNTGWQSSIFKMCSYGARSCNYQIVQIRKVGWPRPAPESPGMYACRNNGLELSIPLQVCVQVGEV